MVGGGLLMVSSSTVDSYSCPCLCLDSLSTSALNHKNSFGDQLVASRSSFPNSWQLSAKTRSVNLVNRRLKKHAKSRKPMIVNELAGQYEDSFEDVKTQTHNYFTYKAVRTVMNQLYEMNPTEYRWFYNFVVNNKPGDGKRFLRSLVKERQELAERVMVTRLHLYGKWIKKCDHTEMYKEISDENLELMRERLMETVIWPTDDTNTEKIG